MSGRTNDELGAAASGTVPVAVVGLAALMPGARDAAEFWRNIVTGRDLITEVPASHWAVDDFYDPDPDAPDKTYCRRGAFLPEIEFDPLAHGLPPATLPALDPGQLLGLVVADELLADLDEGLAGPLDRERVSVILGSSTLSRVGTMDARIQRPMWLKALREQGIAEPEALEVCERIAAQYVPWQEASFPGLLSNVVAGRIANRLDLHGTNCTIDAACASSLAAVSAAVNELSLGKADLVITGGVDATNNPLMYVCFSKTPALSPTGDARPFAEDADGTLLGEGLAMLGLKRLDAAERDGDRIYAVIRGIGTSSDGRGGAIYAPMPQGQVRALRRAYEAAGYGPETVELVEAHGTATRAGDAAEFESLRQVFGETGRPGAQWCALGTVKSQIGHTKAAAGAAGLVKTVLALHHRVLPPTIKVGRPNARLGIEGSPFYLNTAARPWVRPDDHARRASVSSFGFGGANFHVAMEEYQRSAAPRFRALASELVLFGADSAAELVERVRQGSAEASAPSVRSAGSAASRLADVAKISQLEFDVSSPVRLAVVARDEEDLRAKLDQAAARIEREPDAPFSGPNSVYYDCERARPGRIAFVFPGQGAQYVGMGGDVAMAFPPAQDVWDFAAGVELGERGLHEMVFPPPAFSDEDRAAQGLRLTETSWAQPALAAHSLSLLALLAAIGIEPDCVAGHSLGELVALHAAGAMDAESLLRLARRRGELMARIDGAPGAMLAVGADAATVEAAIEATRAASAAGSADAAAEAGPWPANFNAPRQTVVSGTEEQIEALRARLSAAGFTARRLEVSAAFHSPLVERVAEPLRGFLDGLDLAAPRIDVYGNADARVYDRDAGAVRSRLAEHTAAPVRFQEQIEAKYADGVRTFVEVGAGSALAGLIGQILGERPHLAVSLDRRGRDGVTAWHEGLARLAVGGVPMKLPGLSRNWISAPPQPKYAMDHRRMTVHVDGTGYRSESQISEARAVDVVPSTPPPQPRPLDVEPRAPIERPAAPQPSASHPLEPDPVMSDSREFASSEPSAQWLAAVQEIQRQTAEAHMHFQTVLGDAHRSFLQLAENTFAAFTSAPSGGHSLPPQLVAPAPVTAPPPLAAPPIPSVPAATVPTFEPLAPAPVFAAANDVAPAPVPESERGLDLKMLLEVVADKTGYPIDMLDGSMDLEADLGIDSIKKVEIFAAVRQQAAGMPAADSPQMAELFQLRTADEVVRWAGSGHDGHDVTSSPDVSAGPGARDHSVDRPEISTEVMRRLQVRPLAAPASGLALAGLTRGPLVVIDGGSGLAEALVGQLASRGLAAVAADEPEADMWGVILLGGMAAISGPDEAASVNRAALRTARIVAARMAERGGVFVTVQDTGGCFGLLDPDPTRAWLGGLAALARTAALEWPLAAVKAIDCQRGARDEQSVAAALVEELLTGGSTLDVGLRADGTRWTVTQDEAAPSAAAATATADAAANPVVVATGGARGVTAAAMIAWAGTRRAKMLLIGRTALVDEPASLAQARDERELTSLLAAQARATGAAAMPAPAQLAARAREIIAAREVRATLTELERSGTTVRYAALDITDRAALERELDRLRRDWGPVTGIVHGAGVLADKAIADKTDEQFDRVYAAKVEGLRVLLAATASDPLDLICLFSSVAARYGNVGQSDYAMANEILNQVACAEQARRPAWCRVRSIGWGPWAGGMVTASLAAYFTRRGVPLIPLDAGARAFVAEAGAADDAVQVLIGAGADPGAMAARPRIAAEVVVDARTHGYLADHAPAGVPVLPLAMAVEWFSAAGRAHDPGRETALCDIRVLTRIDLPNLEADGHRFTIEGRAAEHDPSSLDLRLMSPTGIAHYRARLVAPDGPAGTWAALATSTTGTGNGVPPESVYESPALFHGPGFRTLRQLDRLSRDGADARVVGLREVGWPGDLWWTDPAAIDGALQAAVLWARHASGDATLPMGVDLLRVRRAGPAPGPLRALVRAGTVDGDQMRCDIALLDKDGLPRATLFGVSLIRRPDMASALGAGSVATA